MAVFHPIFAHPAAPRSPPLLSLLVSLSLSIVSVILPLSLSIRLSLSHLLHLSRLSPRSPFSRRHPLTSCRRSLSFLLSSMYIVHLSISSLGPSLAHSSLLPLFLFNLSASLLSALSLLSLSRRPRSSLVFLAPLSAFVRLSHHRNLLSSSLRSLNSSSSLFLCFPCPLRDSFFSASLSPHPPPASAPSGHVSVLGSPLARACSSAQLRHSLPAGLELHYLIPSSPLFPTCIAIRPYCPPSSSPPPSPLSARSLASPPLLSPSPSPPPPLPPLPPPSHPLTYLPPFDPHSSSLLNSSPSLLIPLPLFPLRLTPLSPSIPPLPSLRHESLHPHSSLVHSLSPHHLPTHSSPSLLSRPSPSHLPPPSPPSSPLPPHSSLPLPPPSPLDTSPLHSLLLSSLPSHSLLPLPSPRHYLPLPLTPPLASGV
ncbi:hypothetical protein C7M84_020068 [Penaeus vannamei]|uniref:Uncharacterized protein n=1 Tax=Penaeus vannamei TaxID=6689 RepID=A0A3R7NMM9_PENVA|nr:hypothetical protein C7M84_020068 [Penaeus vannamei]